MAKMVQDTVVIEVAKLIKNDDEAAGIMTDEMMAQLEAIMAEIVNDSSAMIEVTQVKE